MRVVADETTQENVIALEIIEDQALHCANFEHLVAMIDDLITGDTFINFDLVNLVFVVKLEDLGILS